MRAALPRPDAAMVFPGRLAVARKAGPDRLGPSRQAVPGHRRRIGAGRRASVARRRAGRAAACRNHQPLGIRDVGIDQLHLHADDGMEPGLLGGCGETDDPVEAPAVGDGERRDAQLDGARREVRRGGGAVEEGEVGVRVELGIGRRGHGATRAAWRTAARPSRRRGATKIEQAYCLVNQRLRATKAGPSSSQGR